MQKKIAIIFMSGLTFSAMNAFNWQVSRYYQSLEKWENINNELMKTSYETHTVENLRFLPQDLTKSIFKIIDVEGFLPYQICLVRRFKDGRDGSLVVSSLKKNQIGYIINLGWIPQQKVNDIMKSKDFINSFNKIIKFTCLVKFAEKIDELSKSGDSQIDTFINLQKFSDRFDLQNDQSKIIYLERMMGKNEEGGIVKNANGNFNQNHKYLFRHISLDEDLKLYPLPLSIENLDMPYLTPDKHQSYFMFWGGCTLMGIYSLFKLVR